MIFGAPGCHSGCLGASFLFTCSQLCCVFSRLVLRAPSQQASRRLFGPKCAKMELSKRGQDAIRTRLRRLYEGRPVRPKLASRAALGAHFLDFGSILCDLWEYFPHFLRPWGHLLPHCVFIAFFSRFGWKTGPPGGCERQGRRPLWRLGNIAFWPLDDGFTVCF